MEVGYNFYKNDQSMKLGMTDKNYMKCEIWQSEIT